MTAIPPPHRHRRYRLLASFAATLVAIDLFVHAFHETWERHSPDDYAEKVATCAARPRDLVFVGGSPVAEGIDPQALGPIRWQDQTLSDAYAVGLNGGTTSDVYFAVTHACPTPPAVLVYGLTVSDINDSRHEPHGPHSLMTWADLADWQQTRPDAVEWVTRQFLIGRANRLWAVYRYQHGIRMWAATQADRLAPGCCPVARAEAERHRLTGERIRANSGHTPMPWFADRRYDQMKASGWVAPPFTYVDRYRTGSHVRYLHRLIDWAEAHGTTVVLIDMPVTADLEARHPAEVAEFRTRLAEVERDRGVTVLRATRQATGLDDCHFADLIHLNREGCQRLTAWVREELTRLGREPEDPPTRIGGQTGRAGVDP